MTNCSETLALMEGCRDSTITAGTSSPRAGSECQAADLWLLCLCAVGREMVPSGYVPEGAHPPWHDRSCLSSAMQQEAWVRPTAPCLGVTADGGEL